MMKTFVLKRYANKVSITQTKSMVLSKLEAIFCLILFLAFLVQPAQANDSSPVGLWKNIDDVSGMPRGLIRIIESNGTLNGKIEKVFLRATEDTNPLCDKCEGVNKNAPIIGLQILSGLKKQDDEYVDGEILDPDNGKVYSCQVRLIDGGNKLLVRGYVGIPLLGRSQTWERQE